MKKLILAAIAALSLTAGVASAAQVAPHSGDMPPPVASGLNGGGG